MKLLLDTHILIWAAGKPARLTERTRRLIEDTDNEVYFSAASIWEVAIKTGQGRDGFNIHPQLLHTALIDRGYRELPISSSHSASVMNLPDIHKDPFDRMMIAQARAEGLVLLTVDENMIAYGEPVRMA